MKLPNKKYQIIYADPAWQYNSRPSPNQIGKYKSTKAKTYYETMTFEEIKSLKVNEIANKDCYLFLWVTFPLLPRCLEIFKVWGFEYKTLGFSWIKTNIGDGKPYFGIGYYTKSNCEVCLMGIKGKPSKQSDYVSSVVISSREGHSKKPSIVREKIIELCGDVPRIELFAREKIEGWDVWGNEIPKDTQNILKTKGG